MPYVVAVVGHKPAAVLLVNLGHRHVHLGRRPRPLVPAAQCNRPNRAAGSCLEEMSWRHLLELGRDQLDINGLACECAIIEEKIFNMRLSASCRMNNCLHTTGLLEGSERYPHAILVDVEGASQRIEIYGAVDRVVGREDGHNDDRETACWVKMTA